ncbi:MAG: 3-phosphoserine/phosphohydroxythreonine transaminase [Bacteroidetes bacterium]|nr:3-phosphoserine/phosphohydroxythreonine transaminase [Bacteroidota bacterium]
MTKVHNFSAGPSILAPSAFEKSIEDIRNFAGTGLSILEISHRSKQFEAVMDETRQLVADLLNVPSNYDILFLGGGASTQFYMVPHNFLRTAAAYTKTGVWASGALKEAKLYGDVKVVASSEDANFSYIPKDYTIPADVDYFHCTSNNTIYGTQMKSYPESPVPVFCDMSSDIFSKPVDVSKFGLIYAGAQKNMGPAGVTLVIVNKDLYSRRSDRPMPSMLDYKLHGEKGSMHNTPPVFPILVSKYNLEWVKEQGGVKGMAARNAAKSSLLYSAIDSNPHFTTKVAVEDRSDMNVCWVLAPGSEHLEEKFNTACKEAGISGIKGHRSTGGYRASLYNALPIESVQALVHVMETFA